MQGHQAIIEDPLVSLEIETQGTVQAPGHQVITVPRVIVNLQGMVGMLIDHQDHKKEILMIHLRCQGKGTTNLHLGPKAGTTNRHLGLGTIEIHHDTTEITIYRYMIETRDRGDHRVSLDTIIKDQAMIDIPVIEVRY